MSLALSRPQAWGRWGYSTATQKPQLQEMSRDQAATGPDLGSLLLRAIPSLFPGCGGDWNCRFSGEIGVWVPFASSRSLLTKKSKTPPIQSIGMVPFSPEKVPGATRGDSRTCARPGADVAYVSPGRFLCASHFGIRGGGVLGNGSGRERKKERQKKKKKKKESKPRNTMNQKMVEYNFQTACLFQGIHPGYL